MVGILLYRWYFWCSCFQIFFIVCWRVFVCCWRRSGCFLVIVLVIVGFIFWLGRVVVLYLFFCSFWIVYIRFICSFLWSLSLVSFILSFLVIIMCFVVFGFFCLILIMSVLSWGCCMRRRGNVGVSCCVGLCGSMWID